MVRIADEGDELVLRFLNFYGSQQKQLAIGTRVRVRGEVRGGFFGLEMVHPAYRVVQDAAAPLPESLTPVYPSAAGLSQAYLRKAIHNAMERYRRCRSYCRPTASSTPSVPIIRFRRWPMRCVCCMRHRLMCRRRHSSSVRIRHGYGSSARNCSRSNSLAGGGAPASGGAGPLRQACAGRSARALRSRTAVPLTGAQQRVWAEIQADLAEPHPR